MLRNYICGRRLSLLIVLVLLSQYTLQAQLTAHVHQLKASPSTVAWGYYDPDSKPVMTIDSGDTVEVQTILASAGTLNKYGVPDELIRPEMREMEQITDRRVPGHLLVGPIFIRDAKPGDVLEVRILELHVAEAYAINLFPTGGGVIPEDFPYTRTKVIPLDRANSVAAFSKDIAIPLHPFFGSMGVAPAKLVGRISSIPPGPHAGNLDNKELTAGSTLYIPVNIPGALFSFGDGHAGQGDGEVDGTAIETSLAGKLQFIVRKDLKLPLASGGDQVSYHYDGPGPRSWHSY